MKEKAYLEIERILGQYGIEFDADIRFENISTLRWMISNFAGDVSHSDFNLLKRQVEILAELN